MKKLILQILFFLSAASANSAFASFSDPFNTEKLTTPSPNTYWHGDENLDVPDNAVRILAKLPKGALSLVEITNFALENNPNTHFAWAQAKAAAAQLGMAKSAYLPQINAGGSGQYSLAMFNTPSNAQSTYGANVSINYLLLDFGTRSNNIKSARFNTIAADLNQNYEIQQVILQVQAAYYQALGQQALMEADKKTTQESTTNLDASQALRKEGMATIGDVYQSQSALAQANLNLQQATGNYQTALGQLATTMGLPADTPLQIIPMPSTTPTHPIHQNIEALLNIAKHQRPDLLAAEAQVRANQSQLAATKAAMWPTLQLSANTAPILIGAPVNTDTAVNLTLSMPLFTGYSQSYAVRQAKAKVLAAQAARDALNQQVAQQVWQAYFALQTAANSIGDTDILLHSSEQAVKQAIGQYKAGVGNILTVLTTQTSLANARVQSIQARLNWYVALAQLAAAMGTLEPNHFSRLPGINFMN